MDSANVIVFDVETTGTDRRRDQVIELCVQFGLDADARSVTWRFRPTVSIHPGAQAVHGITMEDLAECPPFAAYGERIRRLFADAHVLVGYNMSFDIGMLQAEYRRMDSPYLDLRGKQIVDAFRLWQQCEPRSLQHAHQRFVGDSFAAAHSATADVAATGRVLRGMVNAFGLADRDWNGIAQVCEPERATWVGPSRHIRCAPNGRVVLGFGKHRGKPVHELSRSDDRDYLLWILDNDFPPHVHAICQAAINLSRDDFYAWLRHTFGQSQSSPPSSRGGGGGSGPATGSPETNRRASARGTFDAPTSRAPHTSHTAA